MSDSKTATERLREMLDERGVEWKNVGGTTSADGMTEWLVDGMTCQAVNRVTFGIEHLALFIPILTPELAIAATLGNAERTCRKVIPDEIEGYVFCSECGAEIGEYGYPNYCHNCGAKVIA